MLIEHITAITGNSTIRDTSQIDRKGEYYLPELERLPLGKHTLPLPKSSLKIQVTVAEEGAIFDIVKGEDILYMSICNFSEKTQGLMFPLVVNMSNRLPFLKQQPLPKPKLRHWMYTIPVANFLGSVQDSMIAGSAELAIWWGLFHNPNIEVDRVASPKPTEKEMPRSKVEPSEQPNQLVKFEVGQEFPIPEQKPMGYEGARVMRDNLSFAVLCYSLQPDQDRLAFTKAPLRYGLYKSQAIPFFLLDNGDVQYDAAINIHKFEDKVVEDWLNSKANSIMLYLIHAKTNILYGIRQISINSNLAEEIRDVLEQQDEKYTDAAEVDKEIESIANKVSTAEMVNRAIMKRL